jgi:hypothetical protein
MGDERPPILLSIVSFIRVRRLCSYLGAVLDHLPDAFNWCKISHLKAAFESQWGIKMAGRLNAIFIIYIEIKLYQVS